MGKRKQKYIPKVFESTGEQADTSANIYHSMLVHPKFKALSKGAQLLYIYCKDQYYNEHPKPKPQSETLSEIERQRCFTMNQAKWRDTYELYTNKAQFYKDMQQLIQAGFIDIVEYGKVTRTKSIYMLSDRWQGKPP